MVGILSRTEVDALLESVKDGTLDLEPDRVVDSGGLVRYDFSKPHTLSRIFESNLATVSDSFAKQSALAISNYYRSTVSITPMGLEHVLFRDYIGKVPKPSCIAIVNLPPLRGQAILNIDANLIFAVVDRMMGGGGKAINRIREFTEIEFRISERIVEKMLGDLTIGAKRFIDLDTSMSRIENNPEFVNICPGMDRVVSLLFEMGLPNLKGMMNICIPVSAFEPVIESFDPVEELPERSPEEKREDMFKIGKTLEEVELEVCVLIGEAALPLGKAKVLNEGDVIVLDRKISDPVEVLVENVPKFLGIPGHACNRKAVKLISVIKGGERD